MVVIAMISRALRMVVLLTIRITIRIAIRSPRGRRLIVAT